MKILLSLWLLLAALIGVSVQQCTIERIEEIILDIVKSTEIVEAGQNITGINDVFYNCLSTSQTLGIYNSLSVSILYTRSDTANQSREVRYNMRCNNGIWRRVGQQSEALMSNDTRRNCSDCTNQTVNDYHCTPCDDSCTGLNQCYGPMADQCCSYIDGGNCIDDCGMNREGNSTFHCVCSNFWIGDNCDECGIGNCAMCDDSAISCLQCQGGFQLNINDTCIEMPEDDDDDDDDDDDLETSIIGIIIAACVIALVVLIILIIAICAIIHHRRNPNVV